jgi:hypothetical protein
MTLRFTKPTFALLALTVAPVQAQTQLAAVAPRPLAPAVTAPFPAKPQVPSSEAMVILIRSSIVALSHANVTNNYSVLNALGSESFRAANPPARLAQLFAPFRTNNIDMNPVVYVTPQLIKAPAIENGRLHLIGLFPTQPMQVNYDLMFEPSRGSWKLFGLSVNLARTAAAATAAAPPPNSGR